MAAKQEVLIEILENIEKPFSVQTWSGLRYAETHQRLRWWTVLQRRLWHSNFNLQTQCEIPTQEIIYPMNPKCRYWSSHYNYNNLLYHMYIYITWLWSSNAPSVTKVLATIVRERWPGSTSPLGRLLWDPTFLLLGYVLR